MSRLFPAGITASTSRKSVVALLLVALCGAMATFGAAAGAATGGYGLIVGHVSPCTAKTFDKDPYSPFIVVLMKNGATLTTYNVSADAGTASYHFDVPVGKYTLATTWQRTKVIPVTVKLGKTTVVNIHATCAPANF
ncbi:MAG TPA: hypothetical protein VIJ40_04825 [Acidimicrobiales bacterium]